MIPTKDQIIYLWDKYKLPAQKRVHVSVVAKLALSFAKKIRVDGPLLEASALLHDIDKAVGGNHPEKAVEILRNEGMPEVADVVKTHSLQMILDPALAPKTWEQKLLYLADKMVKYDIVGVDERFTLWRAENLPPHARRILDRCYPKVKELAQEVFSLVGYE